MIPIAEKRDDDAGPNAAERRHAKMRAISLDILAFATAEVALIHYNPDGFIAIVIIFVGAYVVAMPIWKLLWIISGTLFAFLSVLIYVSGLIMGLSSLPAILLSAFLPGIAQVYWIWSLWPVTASLTHPLTLSCVAWLVLAGITMFERNLISNWRQLAGRPGLRRDRVAPKPLGDHRPW